MIGRRPHDDAQAFDDAWSGRAPRDEQIAELVALAESLCESAADIAPSTAFRTDLRARLMAEADTVLVPMPGSSRTTPATPTRPRKTRRRFAGVTAALIASAGAVSIVASSASAVPGDMLYGVKRQVEKVELQLHRDDASRGAFQLDQASERLAEARKLSSKGASEDLIADALSDFSSSAAKGSDRLFQDFSSSGKEESIRTVNDFTAAASVHLTELSTGLPDGVGSALGEATETLSQLATEASSLCKSCTTADVQSLVSAVTGIGKDKATGSNDSKGSSGSKGDGTSKPAATATQKPSSGTTTTPTPTKAPTTSAPTTPAPTTTTKPPLNAITDPLLGGLLGDDDQEGLVPGLLNGLLGGGKK